MALDYGSLGVDLQKKIIMNEELILAFDPGRDKTGFAFVNFNGDLICSGIFFEEAREKFFEALISSSDLSSLMTEKISSLPEKFFELIKFVAIGNGTSSKNFSSCIKNFLPHELEIKLIDERNTTLEARRLYWKIHKPKFFALLIPEGLRVPKRILDDLAAWAIALKALKKNL